MHIDEQVYTQEEYEARLAQEASIMVSLEVLREALVDLDYEIDRVDDLNDECRDGNEADDDGIAQNDEDIAAADDEISDQEYRAERL